MHVFIGRLSVQINAPSEFLAAQALERLQKLIEEAALGENVSVGEMTIDGVQSTLREPKA